jgi:hypothetical protein
LRAATSTVQTIGNRQSEIGNLLVDPTGLKPAPHGLKGRCSVTRAPDQQSKDEDGRMKDEVITAKLIFILHPS